MSNQVYENSRHKYYAQNGLNLYQVVQQTIPYVLAPTPVIVAWSEQIVQNPGILQLSNLDREFLALREGMYSFTFSFQMVSSTTPQTIDIEPQMALIYYNDALGFINVSGFHQRIVAPGVGTGDDEREILLTGTVYMNVGDYVYVQIASRGGFGIDLQYSSCVACLVY